MSIKERLMTALNTAANAYNEGADENNAVIKAAAEHDLNADESQRLVEMFNTAKTVSFFKTAADRAGDVGLADPAVIIPQLYSKQAAPEPEKSPFVNYLFYDGPPAAQTDDVDLLDGIKIAKPIMDIDLVIAAIHQKEDILKRASEKCGSTAATCEYTYSKAIEKLADYVLDNRVDFHEMDAAAVDLYQKKADNIMEGVAQRLRVERKPQSNKRTVHTFFSKHARARDIVSTAITAADGYIQMTNDAERLEKEAQEIRSELSRVFFGSEEDKPRDEIADLIKEPERLGKSAQDKSGLTSTLLGAATKPFFPIKKDVSLRSLSPQQEESDALAEKIKNLHRQAALEDLMVSDPIIRAADPEVVAQSYAALLRVAPEVSTNKEVVRSALRQAVTTQGLSPYDAKSLAELDNELRKQLYVNVPRKDKDKTK